MVKVTFCISKIYSMSTKINNLQEESIKTPFKYCGLVEINRISNKKKSCQVTNSSHRCKFIGDKRQFFNMCKMFSVFILN